MKHQVLEAISLPLNSCIHLEEQQQRVLVGGSYSDKQKLHVGPQTKKSKSSNYKEMSTLPSSPILLLLVSFILFLPSVSPIINHQLS